MKKVLIDYAEVISRPFAHEIMLKLAELVDMDPAVFEERYWALRPPYDCGQPAREYWAAVIGSDADLDDSTLATLVRIDVDGWLELNPEAVEWLADLTQTGTRPWLLSNAPHALADAINELPIASLFEGLVFSARIGVAKPSHECFRAAIAAMQTDVDNIFFIDDRQSNIDAAARIGMSTLLFSGSFPKLPTDTQSIKER